MNTEDDIIISRLSLSAGDVKRLTVTQIRNIKTLLVQPPEHLLEATRRINHHQLTEEFRLHRISIHATEFPLALLLYFIKTLIPNWRMSHLEQNVLCASLSRNAASQIVSVPLFIAVWGSIAQQLPPTDRTPLQKSIDHSKKIIELQCPDTHFVFSLISQRLGPALQGRVDQGSLLHLRWEDLRREMVTVAIKLAEGAYQDFQASLTSSGIYAPPPDNKVHVPMLLAVAADYSGPRAKLADKHECTVSSTVARMHREICPKWVDIRGVLEGQLEDRMRRGEGGGGISEVDFTSVLRNTGGVIITAEDAAHFWEHLVQTSFSADSSSLEQRQGEGAEWGAHGRSLSLQQLHSCLGPLPQTYSSLSPLMRQKQHYSHKTSTAGHSEDHMESLLGGQQESSLQENGLNASHQHRSSLAHFPWQVDEAHPVSNLRHHALQSLRHCSPEVLRRLVNHLYSQECRANSSVARSVLHEGLALAGVHFPPHDMHSLWQEMQASLHSLAASELVRWLQLEHIPPPLSVTSTSSVPSAFPPAPNPSAGRIDPARPTGVLDPVHSPMNPRHSQPQTTWDASPATSLAQYSSLPSSTPCSSVAAGHASTFGVECSEPDSTSSPLEDTPLVEEGSESYKSIIAGLLQQRPQLAHAFRRISSGSGLGKGTDLRDCLLRAPFSLPLAEHDAWALVCRMAGSQPETHPALVCLRFNDAMSFLEAEAEAHLKPTVDPRRVSIQKKLQSCKHIRGSRRAMSEQSHLLRTRLRHIRQRGAVTSWDCVPDVCYPQEFCQLTESIDLRLTQEEVIYIYRNVISKDEDPSQSPSFFNQCNYGMPLGASISFLGSLCEN